MTFQKFHQVENWSQLQLSRDPELLNALREVLTSTDSELRTPVTDTFLDIYVYLDDSSRQRQQL